MKNLFDSDHEKVVDVLLRNGANPNAEADGKWTPLMLAVRNGNFISINTCL